MFDRHGTPLKEGDLVAFTPPEFDGVEGLSSLEVGEILRIQGALVARTLKGMTYVLEEIEDTCELLDSMLDV